ncbi:hypothetical protein F5878DRAFT_2429 [Lentinula raphanica]|uniref:T6SS Phospholipase effector Tle1-like catalytic domain-containing protein n=1 Tax=Lentinula raphanica TaxID=153919 RepID=A0AA38PMQ4_9AGAR|nr:hypothetical protein F5878DRAFT_2429 [Lentinula raphanica]
MNSMTLVRTQHQPSTTIRNQPDHSEKESGPPLSLDSIPPQRTGRTLILCFDGIGAQPEGFTSNVTQLHSLLEKWNPSQVVYYQSNITYPHSEANIVTSKIAAVAYSIDACFSKGQIT